VSLPDKPGSLAFRAFFWADEDTTMFFNICVRLTVWEINVGVLVM